MQSVYAVLQSKRENHSDEERFLYLSIKKMYDLYVLLIRLLVEVKDLEKKHIKISQKKFLATQEELRPNTKFINNQVIQLLEESVSLNNYLDTNKLNYWILDNEYVSEIWKLLKKSDAFENYLTSGKSSFNEDRDFVAHLFKNVIAPNDKLADYFEDKNISWVDDIPFVNTWILKTLNNVKPKAAVILGGIFKDEDDKNFVSDLFRETLSNHQEYESIIEEKTPNWDKDRIAEIDMILIKMAVVEFLKFQSIPTRVTINEYIEISKDYSTEKSSFFINGVLDKILKDFETAKSLNKIGRGLL